MLRLQFSGEIRKPLVKTIGQDQAIEFQVMKKNYAKQGEEATFTWVRVTLFKPAQFQFDQLQEGNFIAGSGEFTLRSFVNSSGVKLTSAEVRCTSFDVDCPRTEHTRALAQDKPAPSPSRPAPATPEDDTNSPPF